MSGCVNRGEDDAVGYDAGKKVKGRKLHALVDVEGLPLRVAAGMQDRGGAGLVLAGDDNERAFFLACLAVLERDA